VELQTSAEQAELPDYRPATEPEPADVQGQEAEESAAAAQSAVDEAAQAESIPSPEPAAPTGRTVVPPPLPASVDGKLNDKERELLRQLHAELAQREQQRARRTSNGGGTPSSNRWQVDRSGDRQAGFSQTMHGTGGRPGAGQLVNGSAPKPPFPPAG
jgi:hypothetical protein